MTESITTFKIKITEIQSFRIRFDLFVGDKVEDAYINMVDRYQPGGRLILTPKQFTEFAQRLIAYVYYTGQLDNDELKTLWELRLNVFDSEDNNTSHSVFEKERSRLFKLKLIKKSKHGK